MKLMQNSAEVDENNYTNATKSASADNKLLAKIMTELLAKEKFSSLFIEEKFRIGNRRSKSIMSELEKLRIVTEKYANTPRKVIPRSIEDVSDEVLIFLNNNCYFKDDIEDSISKRIDLKSIQNYSSEENNPIT